jgi:hypothetical protein
MSKQYVALWDRSVLWSDGTPYLVGFKTISEAAELMELNKEDIEWAMEEYGRCDGVHYTALEVDAPHFVYLEHSK